LLRFAVNDVVVNRHKFAFGGGALRRGSFVMREVVHDAPVLPLLGVEPFVSLLADLRGAKRARASVSKAKLGATTLHDTPGNAEA